MHRPRCHSKFFLIVSHSPVFRMRFLRSIPFPYQNLEVPKSGAANFLVFALQDESNGFELMARDLVMRKLF